METLGDLLAVIAKLKEEIDALRAEARRNLMNQPELQRISGELAVKLNEMGNLNTQLQAVNPEGVDDVIPDRYLLHKNK